ncbi:MAG: hypothetical protein WC503_00725 [Candidatus Shapirobacteria bacterium]
MTSSVLMPNFVDMDFSTIKAKIQEQLELSSTFNNINYSGGNITVLVELISYLAELNTFYLNKIAKNCYIDSADIYENVSRLAQLVGYYPKGYVSARTTLKLTILDNVIPNSTIRIYPWTDVWTSPPTEEDAYISGTEAIYFSTSESTILVYPDDFTLNETTEYYEYSGINVSQGRVKSYQYYGRDLVDNKIYLSPLTFGCDDDTLDGIPSIKLEVNGTEWTRIDDFYEDLSGLYADDDNVYTLRYDKYENYIIEFSEARNIPISTDLIEVTLLETLGEDGNVGSGWITQANNDLITVTTSAGVVYNLDTADFSINNESGAIGGSSPETIDQIKENTKNITHAQYRCVTKSDYTGYLIQHSTILDANVWGEQEQNPITNGDVRNYNKVYLSIVPEEPWTDKLIYYTNDDGINIATSYDSDYMTLISEYLEPRKMLCAYEEFVIPDFTYFKFTLSIKIRSNYRFIEVQKDLKDKLEYYFLPTNRSFNEKISFNEIVYFLLDLNQKTITNSFSKVAGILNLNIREISFYDKIGQIWINPYNYDSSYYPKYIYYDTAHWEENLLKVIQLDQNQFPYLSVSDCVILEETY